MTLKRKHDNYWLIMFCLQYKSVGNWTLIICIISVCETILPLAADFVLYSTNRHLGNYCCSLSLPFYLLRKYIECVWIIKYSINIIFLSAFDTTVHSRGELCYTEETQQQELVLLRPEESWDAKNVKKKRLVQMLEKSYMAWGAEKIVI